MSTNILHLSTSVHKTEKTNFFLYLFIIVLNANKNKTREITYLEISYIIKKK